MREIDEPLQWLTASEELHADDTFVEKRYGTDFPAVASSARFTPSTTMPSGDVLDHRLVLKLDLIAQP